MAKHKAATEITIVQEERSSFADFVDRYKWPAAGVFVAISAVVLFQASRSNAEITGNRKAWGKLFEARTNGDDATAALEKAASEVEDPKVASWARFQLASLLAAGGTPEDLAKAKESVFNATAAKGHPLLKSLALPFGPEGQAMSLEAAMEQRITAEKAWLDEKAEGLYTNPSLPENAPRVELQTSEGPIVVGLYMDRAPAHVKNFLAQVDAGTYTGTLFHRTQNGAFIQGGDPNTKDGGDPATWGLGGPATTVPPEDSGLVHATGVLAAAKKGGDKNSSGSQFYITAKPMYEFDANYVVYGTVLEGLDLVKDLSERPTVEGNAERPLDPVRLETVKVLD